MKRPKTIEKGPTILKRPKNSKKIGKDKNGKRKGLNIQKQKGPKQLKKAKKFKVQLVATCVSLITKPFQMAQLCNFTFCQKGSFLVFGIQ